MGKGWVALNTPSTVSEGFFYVTPQLFPQDWWCTLQVLYWPDLKLNLGNPYYQCNMSLP